jgi:hypothetical protein
MMRSVPLETCSAFNKLRNDKFYYKAASCWYFYRVIYNAQIHEYEIYERMILVFPIESYVVFNVFLSRMVFYILVFRLNCVYCLTLTRAFDLITPSNIWRRLTNYEVSCYAVLCLCLSVCLPCAVFG